MRPDADSPVVKFDGEDGGGGGESPVVKFGEENGGSKSPVVKFDGENGGRESPVVKCDGEDEEEAAEAKPLETQTPGEEREGESNGAMIPLVAVENETEPSKAWTAVDVEGEKETTPSNIPATPSRCDVQH